jgi:hypothetical protein
VRIHISTIPTIPTISIATISIATISIPTISIATIPKVFLKIHGLEIVQVSAVVRPSFFGSGSTVVAVVHL